MKCAIVLSGIGVAAPVPVLLEDPLDPLEDDPDDELEEDRVVPLVEVLALDEVAVPVDVEVRTPLLAELDDPVSADVVFTVLVVEAVLLVDEDRAEVLFEELTPEVEEGVSSEAVLELELLPTPEEEPDVWEVAELALLEG